jgi:plastocyanin
MTSTTQPRLRTARTALLSGAAGLAALLLTACQTSRPSGDVSTGPSGGAAATVVADNTSFRPAAIELARGRKVTIEIRNDDDVPHDFAIGDLGLNTGTIEPGATATATFVTPAGDTLFVCTYHGGMEGKIRAR